MAIEKERFKAYRMSGLVAKEIEIVNAMDHNTITKTGSSAILRLILQKAVLMQEVQPLKQKLILNLLIMFQIWQEKCRTRL